MRGAEAASKVYERSQNHTSSNIKKGGYTMAKERKLESPVTLFAAIEKEQYDSLREMAFERRVSLADILREALSFYFGHQKHSKPTPLRRIRTV